MDVKALLETPHRSVHWAFLSRLKATTASTENPETLFAGWKALVSPDVATKTPHVFAEAVSQIVHLTLAGRLSVLQTVQVFTDLIAPPNTQKKSALDPSLLSAVCGGLVQLLVAGGDSLAFQGARSARQNIVRVALERDPSLFSPILHHVYNSLLNPDSGAAAGNSAAADSNVAFATKWENSGRLLKYVITDPTVPSWAQNRALALVFDLLRELSADGAEPAVDRAIVVLDWLVDIGLAVAQTPEFQSTKPATALYMQVDVQGRWDPSRLVEQGTRMIELVFVHANRASEPCFGTDGTGNLMKLISIVDRLKLMTASMLFGGTYGMEHIRQAHSHRASHNRDVLASVLDRLALDNYFSVYASPVNTVIETMGVISKQPFFLAPFLFAWNTRTHPANANAVVSQTALAWLIEMLSKHSNLRLDLLLLFMYLLRRPETDTTLQQILIRDSIPCLATTKDAFATSRAVSIISRLWSQSKDLKAATSPSSALLTGPTDKGNGNGRLRLCCLAVRAWTNLVIHNPRAWRDLQPVVVQFVESKKAVAVGTNTARLSTCILDPEYEWTILMTIRDLVLHQADRYADEVLPMIYALFTYARDSLSVSSTALLIDILSTCAESNAADVRNIWTTILSAQAEFWLSKVDNVTDSDARSNAAMQAAPVLNALARFFKIIATSGDGSGPYVTFRYDILMRYVAPMCGLSITKEATDDGTTSLEISDSSAKKGCLSNLLGVLMDNEVRFMRQSLFSGRNAVSRNRDGIDRQTVDVNASPSQKHVWAQSNLERSRLIDGSLAPTLQRARQIYWNNLKYGGSVLASGNALASMVSAGSGDIEWNDDSAEPWFTGNSNAVGVDAAVFSEQQKIIAELRSLITDVRLSDHWSLHNIAVDAWQVWFANTLRKVQSIIAVKTKVESGASDSTATTADAGLKIVKDVCFKILAALKDQLDPSGVPAHVANAVYALAGFAKTVWSVDQVSGSELCVLANKALLEYDVLAWDKSPDVFWSQKAATQNRDVLVAAIECTSATAICQSHDIAALSRLAQFLMVGLTQCFASGSNMLSSSSVVYSLSRALLHLHTVLSGHIPDKRTFSEETVVVEAEDLRRFIERLNILQPYNSTEKQTSQGSIAVDTGAIGLAISLAAMHRRWISTTINPAMAEHNSTPKASQAQRTVAITLGQAFANISNVEDGQWDSRSLASLYYLCFVWPPRPITQRHIELHKDLFAVTPDRVWQTANRLMRKLWAYVAQDGQAPGMRNVNIISHAEFAFSTLTYHMTMTAGQSTAHSAHLRLVQQLSGWIGGGGDTDSGIKNLAANEKSDLRVSRTVALAVLLGIPMHGVAETVASNEYLPKSQQKKLPVLLGIGSVQYGTTAWLRMSESVLNESLNPILGNSGLAQNTNTGDIQADIHDVVGGSTVEMDDVRVARVSSAVLGVLYAQS
ncbi:hypothetical protein GGI11_003511, partial [Coemansia sp. RSA 2049]